MKNDERISADVKAAQGIGYTIFWSGIFAVLLYRWFYLNQTLTETLDVFMVWIAATLAQFFYLASKGISITYPVVTNRKEELYYVFLAPFAVGLCSAALVYLRRGADLNPMLGGFAGGAVGSFLLFFVYKAIVHYWEKRNTE